MVKWLKKLGGWVLHLLYQIRILFMFEFRLRPRILKMKEFVNRIVSMRQEIFPMGKSLFVFPGLEDTLYFIIYKEEENISVTEVYDEILNRIPDSYQLLPRIPFTSVVSA